MASSLTELDRDVLAELIEVGGGLFWVVQWADLRPRVVPPSKLDPGRVEAADQTGRQWRSAKPGIQGEALREDKKLNKRRE